MGLTRNTTPAPQVVLRRNVETPVSALDQDPSEVVGKSILAAAAYEHVYIARQTVMTEHVRQYLREKVRSRAAALAAFASAPRTVRYAVVVLLCCAFVVGAWVGFALVMAWLPVLLPVSSIVCVATASIAAIVFGASTPLFYARRVLFAGCTFQNELVEPFWSLARDAAEVIGLHSLRPAVLSSAECSALQVRCRKQLRVWGFRAVSDRMARSSRVGSALTTPQALAIMDALADLSEVCDP